MRARQLWFAATAALVVAGARAGGVEFDTIETGNVSLLHFPSEAYIAPYAVRAYENALKLEGPLFGWRPAERTTLILTDYSDVLNGSAIPAPRNQITVYVASDDHTLEQSRGGERMFSTINHELVHIATLDAANDTERRWRRFFGGKPLENAAHPESLLYNYLTVPRLAAPRWYREGSAVFFETWLAGGTGRAQSAFDEMVFRARVRDEAHFYSDLGIESAGMTTDFMTGTNAYLYGTRFFNYLALEHSPQKVVDWLRRDPGSERYYSRQFEKVFGLPLEQAWSRWIEWEHAFQRRQLATLRRYPLTPLKPVVPQGLGSVSRLFVDPASGDLVGAFYYPGVLAHVGMLSPTDGRERKLAEITGPLKWSVTSAAFDAATRTFFYTTENTRHRSLMALDLATGRSRRLQHEARIGDIVVNPYDHALFGLRQEHGLTSLVRLAAPYDKVEALLRLPYGRDLQHLDISADGQWLTASVIEVSGKATQQLFRVQDVVAGRLDPVKQFDFGQAIPEGFVFSPDGNSLVGSTYYTGVSNLFRYDIATGEVTALTNAETGLFRPLPRADGSLLALEYTGTGFRPVVVDARPVDDLGTIELMGAELARRHPVVRSWGAGSPDRVDLDKVVTARGKYRPQERMVGLGRYPFVEGYRDSLAVGWFFERGDPMGLHGVSGAVSVSPDNGLPAKERVHARIDYQNLNWYVGLQHNGASFYDLFGPTKRGLAGDAFLLGYSKVLVLDPPRQVDFSADFGLYTGLTTAPGNQNVRASASTLRSLQFSIAGSNTRSSANAVDAERGVQWSVTPSIENGGGVTSLGLQGAFDAGMPLPVPHTSLWLRTSGGVRSGDRASNLANFYFGAFKNNYVDNGAVQRYRNSDSFPGFRIDQLSGQSYGRAMLELDLPAIRFDAVGTPAFYLGYLRPVLFGSLLVTDPGSARFEQRRRNVGAQADLTFLVNHGLPMTLSAGYARGMGGEGRGEWMLSLKILGK